MSAAIFAALALAPAASADRGLLLGIVDDSLKWTTYGTQIASVNRDLGLHSLRVSVAWRAGQWVPTRTQVTELGRVVAASRGMRVVLSVTGAGRDAPQDAYAREAYCGFVFNLLSRYRTVDDVAVWNEPNTPLFWKPQFDPDGRSVAPAAYEQLLARCYDLLHTLRPSVNVIGLSTSARGSDNPHGSIAGHAPGTFIRQVGEAYRTSGRQRPIMDTVAHHPYPETSAERPTVRHPYSKTIGEGDYDKLLAALDEAFRGTGQPEPGQAGVRVWYLEDGFQTAVPATERMHYEGKENDARAIDPAVHAAQLAEAVRLAYCQPNVGAFFNFELADERRLAGWQSGLLWADWTPKPAYAAFKQVAQEVGAATVDCSKLPSGAR